MREPLMMHVDHSVFLRDGSLVLVDRRYLPRQLREVVCADFQAVARAIEEMVVQGAGDIAIAAGYGLYLAAREAVHRCSDTAQAEAYLQHARDRLIATRPTGFHLAALLGKLWERRGRVDEWPERILAGVRRAVDTQQRRARLTGEWAATLLQDGDAILTHCFPGAALLYMLQAGKRAGMEVRVIADETRPYLQGARLTAWSVAELGVPVTLITDNMAGFCMARGMVSKVFTAADRIAMDGTVANKVGTFQLAVLARYHQLPMYILGYGGPDVSCRRGADIVIEMRDPGEVLTCAGVPITAEGVDAFYPAFDLTPAELVTGVVTDRGILSPATVGDYWKLPRGGEGAGPSRGAGAGA
ncbi:MAG: s-methyl-5-thioribose-1-phosphate isomerase [Syntrophomonadaceae bacterium]|nr:s-methyl-5-thioribose-1-phosphate isomerase [Syntrophomonadaceae bacterium]MDH7497962.1 s-methyl-5-thioribose-1-phosphate isomerase [Syntrophomonadaceae bacterium]